MSSFVSCLLLLVSPVQAFSSNQPTYLGYICRSLSLSLSLSLSIYMCIYLCVCVCVCVYIYIYIFLCGVYPDGTFHCVRQRRLPYFPRKNPSGIAGNVVSKTCYTPRRSTWNVAPARFLRRFLIFFISPQK